MRQRKIGKDIAGDPRLEKCYGDTGGAHSDDKSLGGSPQSTHVAGAAA